jgi:dihydropteroate synthase
MRWQTSRFLIDLAVPRVMGIVNVTPDSFSDGGKLADAAAAQAHCDRLVDGCVDLLGIGGEATRPGARVPCLQEELDRVMPVITHAVTLGVPVSVDTSRAEVMAAALAAGADVINDVRALCRPGALETVASHPGCGVCLMHMQGEPGSMQQAPQYADVLTEVMSFLRQRLAAVQAAGVEIARVTLDPGIGFGKTAAHNWALMQRQAELLAMGRPLLVGWSRKSTLGALTGRPVPGRLAASVAAALCAVQRGARIVRVHDVAATVDAVKVWLAAGGAADAERTKG